MIEVFSTGIFPLLLVFVHESLSFSSLTFYKVGGIYLKSKSYLTSTTDDKACAVNCMKRIKCHGFSYYGNECLLGESLKAWKNTSQDTFLTWMRLPLRLPQAIMCPSDFVYDENTNACFKAIHGAVQIGVARRLCAEAVPGGKLMSLGDSDRFHSVQNYLMKNRDRIGFGTWIRIGASRVAKNADFTWENGQTLSLKDNKWCLFKPGNYTCLSLEVPGSCLEDSHRLAYQDILCEKTT